MRNDLVLPKTVYEKDLFNFTKNLTSYDCFDAININICICYRYSPAAILILLGKIKEWKNNGVDISFEYIENEFLQYLQRMNFFSFTDFEFEEKFTRYSPDNRFIPIVQFGQNSRNDQNIDKDPNALAKKLSEIAITETSKETAPIVIQLKRGIVYSCGELIMNVIQHSRGTGYVFAQYVEYKDYVRIAILDDGIGIKESFRIQESKHFNSEMNDLSAILKALEKEVSSKPIGQYFENAGLGLTLLQEICRLAGNDFTIISMKGYYNQHLKILNETNYIKGTLVNITLHRNKLKDFNKIFKQAQNI